MSAQDDVAEFAALLRGLKERTDRSYGSLARRLNMNTSTLHRYCAGDAVPVDFAPVERFAALCGASAEERLDLHRHWLRALEARRRPHDTAAQAGPGTGPAPHPGSDTSARPDPARGDAGGDPVRPPGRAGGSGPESAGVHAGAPPAGAGAVSGPLPQGPEGRRPWYRRRKRVAVALAAVCALLATVGSLSALPEDRETTASGGRSTGAPSATPATTGPAAPPSDTPSPPAGSAAPSTPPGAGPTPADGRRGPSAPPGSGRRAPAGPPPLTWSADSHAWEYGCGHDYVVAGPPGQVPPPPAPQDARTWAGTQAAVHGGETRVELSVQGTSGTAVVLTALRVRVAGRAGPAAGNAYAMDDEGCGGALTPRYFDVDLDKDRPLARAVAGNDAGTPVPAVRLPYRVSASDPEVLVVTARTARCDCRWYLELDWASQGRTGTVRVDDRGRPFRTSGIEGLPHYAYDTSAREWRPRAR
ncbi:helix-turn-helix domain-containing protein [Streptomyces sp. enrichment culture]|uniref:helix-turn-helix domain-containing protein n=1 Tax=Streptomyces sp. enrichment culture TaxID=1795815 RepID=UPI003F57F2D8